MSQCSCSLCPFSQGEVAGISEENEYCSSGHSIFCCLKSHSICPQSKGVDNLIAFFFVMWKQQVLSIESYFVIV